MIETNFKARFDDIAIGSRVELRLEDNTLVSGELREIAVDGVVVSWMFIEWQTINGKQIQSMLEKSVYMPYEIIKDYAVVK